MNRANPVPSPPRDPYAQLNNYQRQMGLGQYAPVHQASFYGSPGVQQGVPGYAAGLGQGGGNILGVQGGQFSPQSPSFGGGNIPGSFGNDWGYGSGYQSNPIGGANYAQPRSGGMQGGGIGGSTPFLSNIQQQLGQMFGYTPGLGFRLQPQMQATAPPPRPQSTYGGGYNGAVPMKSAMTIPTGASPMMKAGLTYMNNNRGV